MALEARNYIQPIHVSQRRWGTVGFHLAGFVDYDGEPSFGCEVKLLMTRQFVTQIMIFLLTWPEHFLEDFFGIEQEMVTSPGARTIDYLGVWKSF